MCTVIEWDLRIREKWAAVVCHGLPIRSIERGKDGNIGIEPRAESILSMEKFDSAELKHCE